MPRSAPQTVQTREPAGAVTTGTASDSATARRVAEEKAAAEKTADEQAFADAARTGTVGAFENYIQANPSGAHVADARARLAALAEQSRREAEARAAQERAAAEAKVADERAFADAAQANTVAALESYLRNNASGAHVADARQRIAAINEQAHRDAETRAAEARAAAERAAAEAKAADERAWVEAAQAGSAAALEAYIRNNPSGVRVDEARQRIAVINEQARREAEERAAAERVAAEKAAAEKLAAEHAADDRAFAEAARIATIDAYEAYIRDNASGAHVMEASQRLARLRAVAEKKSARAKAAPSSAAKGRITPYVPQKPVYKAPPLSAALR